MATKTKPATYTKLKADKLKHPGQMPDPTDGTKTIYEIHFVTEGTLHTMPCSQTVFNRIQDQKYVYEKSYEFVLGLNNQTKMVERIDGTQTKDFFHERGGKQDAEAGGGVDDRFVLLVRFEDGSLDCKGQPSNCTTETVTEIRDAILDMDEDVRMNDLLANKYMVVDIRQGGNHIYVDPKSR